MEEREMHKATCSDCGKECEVPFKPTEGKPVRCGDCFRKNRPQRKFGGNQRFGQREILRKVWQRRDMKRRGRVRILLL